MICNCSVEQNNSVSNLINDFNQIDVNFDSNFIANFHKIDEIVKIDESD